jgi:NAD(P)-dependent dehydrogenase (short-subunit alcohol dehydrogenase family)
VVDGGHEVAELLEPHRGTVALAYRSAVSEYDVAGQVVIVTGASRGIGLGIARHLARAGATLVVTGRKQQRLDELSAELDGMGAEHLARSVDVSDRDATFALVEEAASRWGRIDGLVANAQTFRPTMPLEDVTERDLDVLLDTGPKGTLWGMQAVLPHMQRRGRGRIVTMGTALGITGGPGYGPYAASNEAIRSLTRTAAREWGRHGVTVNCVCPASAAHRMPPGDEGERAVAFQAMYADHPLGRDGDAEDDIAPAVHFLLSDASRYVTGQTLMVDGGGIMRA